MKVLFLDIDGVLNSFQKLADPALPKEQWNPETMARYGIQLDIWPEYIEHVNAIIMQTGAKVVMSSSWRIGDEAWWETLKLNLRQAGLFAEIIDRTPDSFQLRDENNEHAGKWSCRGDEIYRWLLEHPEVESFAILDDDDDMGPVMCALVQTDYQYGIQEEHVKRAVELLNDYVYYPK